MKTFLKIAFCLIMIGLYVQLFGLDRYVRDHWPKPEPQPKTPTNNFVFLDYHGSNVPIKSRVLIYSNLWIVTTNNLFTNLWFREAD